MGIPFGRDYREIVEDFSKALLEMERSYETFYMTLEEWLELKEEDRRACLRILADDLIYVLGARKTVHIASGTVQYIPRYNVIRIDPHQGLTCIIHLT